MKSEMQCKWTSLFVAGFFLFTLACSSTSLQPQSETRSGAAARNIAGDSNVLGVSGFPEIVSKDQELITQIQEVISKTKRNKEILNQNPQIISQIQHYFEFLGLTSKDLIEASKDEETNEKGIEPEPNSAAEDDNDKDDATTPSNLNAIQRLFKSSLQFIFCEDLRNWDCLEAPPPIMPAAQYRQESEGDKGKAIYAGPELKMETFFTQAWDGTSRASGVVLEFAKRIRTHVGNQLSLAMYGIDDIAGSMKPVYDAIIEKSDSAKVRAVVDIAGIEKVPMVFGQKQTWIFDYVPPDQTELNTWLFSSPPSEPDRMHINFQYDGTPALIRKLNSNLTSSAHARVRVEWPASRIMHNKFAVLEDEQGQKSVWTGTANFSNHCMGTEANSNMSIYIRNDAIAQAYLDEFNLMYEFDETISAANKSRLVSAPNGKKLQIGRFHRNKIPTTQRHFYFDDGTRVRVHFAPADDAEHRVILPMLYSAQAGDLIRISMFGGTGFEIVRAIQYAAAKGAHVRIVFDRQLGHGQTSWIRDPRLNLYMVNPYLGKVERPVGIKPGQIIVRLSTWAGKNHYKVGTLSRRKNQNQMIAEQIIVGSQNWSSGGNDENDENLVSVQNVTTGVKAAEDFNQEFDQHLWVMSKQENPNFISSSDKDAATGVGVSKPKKKKKPLRK